MMRETKREAFDHCRVHLNSIKRIVEMFQKRGVFYFYFCKVYKSTHIDTMYDLCSMIWALCIQCNCTILYNCIAIQLLVVLYMQMPVFYQLFYQFQPMQQNIVFSLNRTNISNTCLRHLHHLSCFINKVFCCWFFFKRKIYLNVCIIYNLL